MATLKEKLRVSIGRDESPSIGIIDSRSVKTSQHVNGERGIDGNKKMKGRKDQIVVDTLGLPMIVSVHGANIHDSKGAESALSRLAHKFPRLKKIIADGGYRGDELKKKMRRTLSCRLEVVLRPDESLKKVQCHPIEVDCRKVFRLGLQLPKSRLGLRVLFRILRSHDSNRLRKYHA